MGLLLWSKGNFKKVQKTKNSKSSKSQEDQKEIEKFRISDTNKENKMNEIITNINKIQTRTNNHYHDNGRKKETTKQKKI